MMPSSPNRPPRKRQRRDLACGSAALKTEGDDDPQPAQPISGDGVGGSDTNDGTGVGKTGCGDGTSTTEDDDLTEEEEEAAAVAAAAQRRPQARATDDCVMEKVVTAAQREAAARAEAVDLEVCPSPPTPLPLRPSSVTLVAASTNPTPGSDTTIDLTTEEVPTPPRPSAALAGDLAALRATYRRVVGVSLTRAMADDAAGMRAAINAAHGAQQWRDETHQSSSRAVKPEPSCEAAASVAPHAPPPPPNVRRLLRLNPHDSVTQAMCARAAFFLKTLEAALAEQPELLASFFGILEEHERGQVMIAGVVEKTKRLLLIQADPPRKDLLLRMNMFVSSGNRITQEHVKRVQETALQQKARADAAGRKVDQLSAEQERVLTEVRNGGNVFFTGCGGTGKSLTLKSVLEILREQYGDEFEKRVAVTAPTGIAASHIGGTTINLAAGVGLPKTHGDFNRVFGFRSRRDQHQADNDQFRGVDFRALEVLVVDEVSMLSGEFFDALDAAVTKMRGNAAKKNTEQAQRQQQGDSATQKPFDVFPDSLRDGADMVALCQAKQRLSLAESLHHRLGSDSPLSVLPRNALGGGDLHESIVGTLTASLTDASDESVKSASGSHGTSELSAGDQASTDAAADSADDQAADVLHDQAAAQGAIDDAAVGQENSKLLPLRARTKMERTTRRWLKTDVEGGAEIVGRIHFDSLALGGIQLLFCGDFFQLPPVSPRLPIPAGKTRLEYIRELRGLPPVDMPVTERPSKQQCAAARAFLSRGHAFQSAAWIRAEFVDIELRHVYRQADREMIEHLQVIRTGGEIVGGLSRTERERIAANRKRAQDLSARRRLLRAQHQHQVVGIMSMTTQATSAFDSNSTFANWQRAQGTTDVLAATRRPSAAIRSAPGMPGRIPSPVESVGHAARFFNERCQRQLPVRRTTNGLIIEATTLYAENVDVNRENREKLARLRGAPTLFTGHDGVEVDMEAAMRAVRKSSMYKQLLAAQGVVAAEAVVPDLLTDTAEKFRAELWENKKFFGDLAESGMSQRMGMGRAPRRQLNEGHIPKSLELKVEAQVMLLINLEQNGGTDHMLVNGSRGVVSRVQPIKAIIREREHQLRAVTGDTGESNPDNAADGMEGSSVAQLKKLHEYANAGFTSLPYVDFWSGRTDVLIEPHQFETEVPGRGKCTRLQLPLKLAWSITVHKSQGLSIEAVRMDLSRCKTPGQAYVALSRAASVSGLELLRPIDPRSVATDPVVSAFYRAVRAGRREKEIWLERCKRWWDYPVGEKVVASSYQA